MILISLPLALIAIVYGAQLLAQSKRENLGGVYKFIAWFVMGVSLLVILHSAISMCRQRCRERMMDKRCMMMDRCDDDMMECPMMYHHRGGMGCCNDMMMNCHDGGNSNSMMNCNAGGSCNDMMDCTNGGKGSSCNEGNMNSSSCPMMKDMKGKMDTAKTKK